MNFPNKHEWSAIVLSGLFGGCLATAAGLLWLSGIDKNALFNFLGAMVGAGAVVFLSLGQREREERRSEDLEQAQIVQYFAVIELQLDHIFGVPQKLKDEDPKHEVNFFQIIPILNNFKAFLNQAIKYASHLNFISRAQLQSVLEQCETVIRLSEGILKECDRSGGTPDFVSGRRAVRTLHNSMNLFSGSSSYRLPAEAKRRMAQAFEGL